MNRFARHLRLTLTDPPRFARGLRFALHLWREQGLLGPLARLDPERFAGVLYRRWLRRYPVPTAPSAPHCRISVLLATADTPPGALEASITSILGQHHTNWELKIAHPANGDVAPPLTNDTRICLVDTPPTRTGQWNKLRQEATGEIVLPLRAGQVLHKALLSWLGALFQDIGLQAARWDTDQLDVRNRRIAPCFLPAWDVWLARSTPTACAPLALRRELLEALGGYADDAGDACEYDLALRLIERLEPEQIRHLPLLLSHRMHSIGDTVADSNHAKSLVKHLVRIGVNARIDTTDGKALRIRLRPPFDSPPVAIIMPTRDGGARLNTAVTSLFERTDYAHYHLYLVDNGSQDGATMRQLDTWAGDPRCTVLRDPSPFNFAAINNRAVAQTSEPLLCLLNDDVEIRTPHWLADLVGSVLQPGVGAAGARLWYPDGTLQHAGVIMGYGGGAGHAYKGCRSEESLAQSQLLREYSVVTAACLITHRTVFDKIGGLDSTHFPVNFNDVDYCLKLREAGFRILYVPTAELVHHESASRGIDRSNVQRLRFAGEVAALRARCARWIADDPAYNPNLTLRREDHTLAWPPRRPTWLKALP